MLYENANTLRQLIIGGVKRLVMFPQTFIRVCAILLILLIGLTPSVALSQTIELFGTKEFRSRITSLPQWVSVIERNLADPIFLENFPINSQTTWTQLRESLEGLTPFEQLEQVNLFWNRWPYRLDDQVYGTEDYWAIPSEFRQNSGDCEDYAIAKYFTLKELGFSVDDMRVIIVIETIRNIGHAVLGVYLDDDVYILDNLSNSVLSHTRLGNYDAQYSVNENYRWGHVRPQN